MLRILTSTEKDIISFKNVSDGLVNFSKWIIERFIIKFIIKYIIK